MTQRSDSEPHVNSFAFILVPPRAPLTFGKKIQFERSTALGFSPNTLMMAMSGIGWIQELERRDIKTYRALVAWGRSQEQGSRMQRDTRRDLEHAFQLSNEKTARGLTPEQLQYLPNSLSTPWRLLFRSLRKSLSQIERRLLVRLALYDRIAHQIASSINDEERLRRQRRAFLPSIQYWTETGFQMPWEVLVVLDATLEHLAWLEAQLPMKNKKLWSNHGVTELIQPPTSPMRHWFDGILAQTEQPDLAELHRFLFRRGVVSRGKVISHDLLKKWASTQDLMPHHAVVAVLEGCNQKVDVRKEHLRLWIARLLTFLCEQVSAFSSKPIKQAAAQKAVYDRLVELRSGLGAA